ncbi:MAG: TRAP transporter small permease [Albidovulum sp.]|uniref:TRAP transporter small permease n=1 Tax=Albidovulum sp. TaxID=1872424 RepID=UPI003CAC1171
MLCMMVMVAIILAQVFYRYVLGNALAWPEELARFLMLWATGLMAPTAYRRGAFVGIDMLVSYLPKSIDAAISILLMLLSLLVIVVATRIGFAEAAGFGGRATLTSLKVPASLDFQTWMKVPRAWMMYSLAICFLLLALVNVEMILRKIVSLAGREDTLLPIPEAATTGAE